MQQLNPSEISALIKQRIGDLDTSATAKNEGTIVMVSDGIVRIHGLADAMYGEMIEFDGGLYGMALNLEQDSVGVVVLGNYLSLQEGQKARCTGRVLEVPVGPELLGRVVDALGNPIDGKGPIDAKLTDAVEKVAPGVIWRQSVDQPVQTGYKSVDTMIPVGRGQRELIIGDRQTGKTAMAIDAIIAQKNSGIKCVYVAIGQKQSTIANVVRKLEETGAMAYTTVVAAAAAVVVAVTATTAAVRQAQAAPRVGNQTCPCPSPRPAMLERRPQPTNLEYPVGTALHIYPQARCAAAGRTQEAQVMRHKKGVCLRYTTRCSPVRHQCRSRFHPRSWAPRRQPPRPVRAARGSEANAFRTQYARRECWIR